jgi:hypothetical protein
VNSLIPATIRRSARELELEGYVGPLFGVIRSTLLNSEYNDALTKKARILEDNATKKGGLTITGDGATISKRPLTNIIARLLIWSGQKE